MSMLYLSTEDMQNLGQAMAKLTAEGVSVSVEHSGEMNFSGCASGSCMAWA